MACPPWWISQLNQQTTSWIGSCACNCAFAPNPSEFFMTSRNPTDETSVQGTVMKDANDESSSAIGCEVCKSGRTVGEGLQSGSHSMPQKFLAIFCRANSAHTAEYPCKVLLCF